MSFSSPRHWPIKQKTSDSFHPFAQISYAKPKEPQIYETKKFDTNFVEKKSTVKIHTTYYSNFSHKYKKNELNKALKLPKVKTFATSHSIPSYSLRDPIALEKFRKYNNFINEMHPREFCVFRKNETNDIFNKRPETSIVQFNYLCNGLN